MNPQQNIVKAALLLVAGLWVLSLLDGAGKWLQQVGITIPVLLWFRYVGQALLVSLICLAKKNSLRWQVKSVSLQLLRGVLMLGSSITFFYALKFLPLAEATAVNFTAPVFTLVLAPIFLKETRAPYRWHLVVCCLVGAFMVIRPGAGFSVQGTAFGLLTALAFSLYQLATRKAAGDEALISNLFTGWVGSILVTMFLLITQGSALFDNLIDVERPTLHWIVLGSLGFIATLGHSLQVGAFRRAAANALTPFMYLQVVSALVVGWVVFGQWPDAISMLGMMIICCTGLVGLYLASETAKKQAIAAFKG